MAVHQRKSTSKKKTSETQSNKNGSPKESRKSESKEKTIVSNKTETVEPITSKVPWRKLVFQVLLAIVMISLVYFTSKKDDLHVFASQKDRLQLTSGELPCSPSYKRDVSKFKECAPKHCGRLVTDIVVTQAEAAHLLRVFKKGLAFGGSSGGASILDVHSGALSHENSFVNIYAKLKDLGRNNIFTTDDFKVYSNVRNKIQQMIAFNFGIPVNKLHLTHPTFFSEMSSRPPKTAHDEYWHVHIDKETYPSFHYTSLLYLSDYGIDFSGGRFIFVSDSKNMSIEPRLGRVSAFTSGAENPHYVERVSSGIRYALTVSFTCDPKFAIADPTIQKFQ